MHTKEQVDKVALSLGESESITQVANRVHHRFMVELAFKRITETLLIKPCRMFLAAAAQKMQQ